MCFLLTDTERRLEVEAGVRTGHVRPGERSGRGTPGDTGEVGSVGWTPCRGLNPPPSRPWGGFLGVSRLHSAHSCACGGSVDQIVCPILGAAWAVCRPGGRWPAGGCDGGVCQSPSSSRWGGAGGQGCRRRREALSSAAPVPAARPQHGLWCGVCCAVLCQGTSPPLSPSTPAGGCRRVCGGAQ